MAFSAHPLSRFSRLYLKQLRIITFDGSFCKPIRVAVHSLECSQHSPFGIAHSFFTLKLLKYPDILTFSKQKLRTKSSPQKIHFSTVLSIKIFPAHPLLRFSLKSFSCPSAVAVLSLKSPLDFYPAGSFVHPAGLFVHSKISVNFSKIRSAKR